MNSTAQSKRIDRREFVSTLLSQTPESLVVSGLGSAAYDVFASGDRHSNYYLWGAMGGSTSLGLGLALAQPEKSVLVITGDGEQLMGIGSLGTIATKQPKNLTIVVLDNGHFGETGMQKSHSSLGTDLVAISKGFGIKDSESISSIDECKKVVQRIKAKSGTAFFQVFIDLNEPERALPPRDGPFIKNRFRAALGLNPF
jgi:phosphonopyruvate decarboxylase